MSSGEIIGDQNACKDRDFTQDIGVESLKTHLIQKNFNLFSTRGSRNFRIST